MLEKCCWLGAPSFTMQWHAVFDLLSEMEIRNDQVWLARVPMIGLLPETRCDIIFAAAQETKGLAIQWSWFVKFHPGERLLQVSEACRTSQSHSYTLEQESSAGGNDATLAGQGLPKMYLMMALYNQTLSLSLYIYIRCML